MSGPGVLVLVALPGGAVHASWDAPGRRLKYTRCARTRGISFQREPAILGLADVDGIEALRRAGADLCGKCFRRRRPR